MKILFGEFQRVDTRCQWQLLISCFLSSYEFLLQRLIYFQNVSEFEVPVEAGSVFTEIFLDVPNTVWTLAPAELSAFMIGPRECLDSVYGHERPSVAAKLQCASTCACDDVYSAARARARVDDSIITSIGALPNGRPELGLVVSGDYSNERTNNKRPLSVDAGDQVRVSLLDNLDSAPRAQSLYKAGCASDSESISNQRDDPAIPLQILFIKTPGGRPGPARGAAVVIPVTADLGTT